MADCIECCGIRAMADGNSRFAQTGGVTGFEISKIEISVKDKG